MSRMNELSIAIDELKHLCYTVNCRNTIKRATHGHTSTGVAVRFRARRPDGLGDREYHGQVVPAAYRAYDLRAGVGYRTVPFYYPLTPVRHGYVPVAEVCANVAGGRAEVPGDGLGGRFAPNTRGFELYTKSLVTHGVFLLARRLFPARGYRVFPRRDHSSL